MSRGLDNRNPGNIRRSRTRYKGEVRPSRDAAFKEFESVEWGYRAMFVLLYTYRKRNGCNTLRKMIGRYAPPSENDTGSYLRFVSSSAGISPDVQVDTSDRRTMVAVVAAMSHIENGIRARLSDVGRGWELFAADFL